MYEPKDAAGPIRHNPRDVENDFKPVLSKPGRNSRDPSSNPCESRALRSVPIEKGDFREWIALLFSSSVTPTDRGMT